MRIGFYAPLKPPDHPAPSGDRRIARLLMQAMTGMGHEVFILSTLRSYNRDGDAALERQTAAAAAAEAGQIAAAWETGAVPKADLLFTYHVYHKAADYLGPALKQRCHLPYVIAEPSVAPKREHGPWAAGYAQAGMAIRRADVLLAVTALDHACLASFAGPARVTLFPPFLDPAPFAAAAARRDIWRATLAAQYGLAADQPWLLAVGMMRSGDKLASFRRLAEAAELARDLPWQLILVGDGPERPAVESAFASLGDRVRLVGQMDAEPLAGLYAASDLYVWPAVNEAYGMALLEAQAAGLPVLSVNTRGVPDVVRHGETGWLAADDSAATLAQALRQLLPDAARRSGMALAARRHVARDLSMTAAQERLAATFIRLGLRP
ncbi:glycosyltransferase family 4 protein [Ferrovibrio xuzhouensis]|uniref:Glycosyltransferase family 4 protein n=1 Tax=Ferrovibrio xuzhouensis TaxID=1576914 RepID=A0ABV7VA06_9PROT